MPNVSNTGNAQPIEVNVIKLVVNGEILTSDNERMPDVPLSNITFVLDQSKNRY